MSVQQITKLKEVLKQSTKVKATKNVNEHLNCTKQGCFSSWT